MPRSLKYFLSCRMHWLEKTAVAVDLELPELKTVADAQAALSLLIAGTARGAILSDEAATMASIVTAFVRTAELAHSKVGFPRWKKPTPALRWSASMHEAFRRRLEALEEARALRDAPPQLISIGFVNGDKTPVIPTVAWTGNFVCWRLEGDNRRHLAALKERETFNVPKWLSATN